MTKNAFKPFEKLYEKYIANTLPIKTAYCTRGTSSIYEVSEYLLDELFKNVKNFRSDFLVDWENISNKIKNLNTCETALFVIAFRENGVDSYTYIGLRAENGRDYFDEFYGNKKVFMLACMGMDKAETTVNLYNIYDVIINHFDVFKDYIKIHNT